LRAFEFKKLFKQLLIGRFQTTPDATAKTNAEVAEERRKGRGGEQATAKAEAGSLRE
jgi:hypothetical protein